ncbi:hypothetical protein [Pontivivens nitratireducens]|uniref:Uncharacterized protein n=1 Tax=Pontivivens nitratireducens TaxID=2758038 RepID=A0A6G7VMC5_9RHOB|nr:hypothetical protein [Pontibrevibacter nitratireducens]QIK41243.1 hypothetical protein G8E03_10945 [Pontibrevibacter nitratireducens]
MGADVRQGNGRTVETRKIDDLVGGGNFQTSEGSDLRMHLILSSTYLDERTAESRTAFTIPENDLAEISRTVVDFVRAEVFADQFESWEADRRQAFNSFLADQPIFAFQDPDELFEKSIPHNASSPEAFVRSLSVLRMRRENEREKQLSELVGTVVTGDRLPENFSELVATAARGIQANELTSLAHHAARRKVVLELLDRMIRRVRDTEEGTPASNHLENTLHTLLAPMRTMGTDPADIVRSSHDLWILDERLTYTAGFSSDQQLRKTVSNSPSSDRPDILLWNTGFGLAPIEEPYGNGDVDDIEPLSRVFIVELKRPGRTKYGSADLIESQIMKYVAQIRGGRIEGFGRRSIRISNDCQFYGLAIADFTPQLLENELDRWEPIDNGTGRRRSFATQNTVIDVIEWSSALKSARERNRALLSMAGLKLRANAAFDKPAPSLSDG